MDHEPDGEVDKATGAFGDPAPGEERKSRPGGGDHEMGIALRSIYQRAVEEAIPDEMLSLLGKLE